MFADLQHYFNSVCVCSVKPQKNEVLQSIWDLYLDLNRSVFKMYVQNFDIRRYCSNFRLVCLKVQ